MTTPVEILGQFKDNQSYSRDNLAKVGFRDPFGTQVRNVGLSEILGLLATMCMSQVEPIA